MNPKPYLTLTAAVALPLGQALAGGMVFAVGGGLLGMAVAPKSLIWTYIELGGALGLVVTWLYSIELWRNQIKPTKPEPAPVKAADTVDLSIAFHDPADPDYPFGIYLRELHCTQAQLEAIAAEFQVEDPADFDPRLNSDRFSHIISRRKFAPIRDRMCRREIGLGEWNHPTCKNQSASLTERGRVTMRAIFEYSQGARTRTRKG